AGLGAPRIGGRAALLGGDSQNFRRPSDKVNQRRLYSSRRSTMEITPINRDVGAVGAIEASFTPGRSAENREVIQAVKAVNASEMLGQDNELTFQRDTQSQRMILRVVN